MFDFLDGPYPDELLYTNINIVNDFVCLLDFGTDLRPGMMCAGEWGPHPRDICSVSHFKSSSGCNNATNNVSESGENVLKTREWLKNIVGFTCCSYDLNSHIFQPAITVAMTSHSCFQIFLLTQ